MTNHNVLVRLVVTFMIFGAALNVRGQTEFHLMTLNVKGEVKILEDNQLHTVENRVGYLKTSQSDPSANLVLEPGASLTLVLPAAGRLDRLSVSGAKRVETKLTPGGATATEGLDINQITVSLNARLLDRLPANTQGAVGIARSGIKPPGNQIQPAKESVVLSRQPGFSWPEEEGAVKYAITIKTPGNRTVDKASTESADHVCGSELEYGSEYLWSVVAKTDSGETKTIVKSSTFFIASQDLADEIHGLLELLESPEIDKQGVLELIALRCEATSVYGQATLAYEQLIQIAPEEARFHAALFELYQRGGRLDESVTAKETAEQLGFVFQTD